MRRAWVLLKNISVNFSVQGITFLISLATAPFIFRHLGEEKFSLLLLFVTIGGWFAILDLGMLTAFVKYLAETAKEKKEKKEILQTAEFVYLILLIIWGVLVFTLSPFLIKKIFIVSSSVEELAIKSLRLMTFSFVLTMLTNFFEGIPRALHRFEISNIKHLFIGFFIPIGTIWLLFLGFGLWQIIWLYVLVNLVALMMFFVIGRKLLPEFDFRPKFNRQAFYQLRKFASFKFLADITARIGFQLNHFLIASFLPVSQLAFYALPAGIGEKALSVLPNLTLPVFSLVSDLKSNREEGKLKAMYQYMVRLSTLLMVPVFCFLMFFGPKFLDLWMGSEFGLKAGLILQVLAASYLLASFPAIPAAVSEGSGRPQVTAYFGVFNSILMVFFSLLLIPQLGLLGAAFSMFFTRLIQVPIFIIWTTRRIVEIKKLIFFWRNYLKIILVGILASFVLSFSNFPIVNFFQFIILGIIYLLIFAGLCLLTRAIKKNDWKVVLDILRRGRV